MQSQFVDLKSKLKAANVCAHKLYHMWGSERLSLKDIMHAATELIALAGVIHRGGVPSELSRVSTRSTALVFGHGLQGLWPHCPATLSSLSLWANALEGHLSVSSKNPSRYRDLHIKPQSDILLHSNFFSCKLPSNEQCEAAFSTALIGNHFAEPPGAFPPWITPDERLTHTRAKIGDPTSTSPSWAQNKMSQRSGKGTCLRLTSEAYESFFKH
eukprot:990108-Amphidinium_carterae.1